MSCRLCDLSSDVRQGVSSENENILSHKPQVSCVGALKIILGSEHFGRTFKSHSFIPLPLAGKFFDRKKLVFSKSDKLVPAGTRP